MLVMNAMDDPVCSAKGALEAAKTRPSKVGVRRMRALINQRRQLVEGRSPSDCSIV